MKKNTLLFIAGICLLGSLYSCKTGLSKEQELFLQYAKLEDRYHNTNYYLNLDTHSDTIAAPQYYDAGFTMEELTSRLKSSFKLIKLNGSIIPVFNGNSIQYPHQFIFSKNADSSFTVELAVFIPDHSSSIGLSKKDIGKLIKSEETEVVLLDITNDAATLMFTDNASRNDYDYTYDFSERKNLNKEKDTSLVKDPSYEAGMFLGERVDEPNATDDFVKDSLLRIHTARVNISLKDEEGKTIVSEGRINSFRHYLWYRNNDMPYEEMRSDYRDIKNNYKEADEDSMHRFHPIEILNIKGRGKLGSVEIFIRSNKGRVEKINLGKHVPQPDEKIVEKTISYHAIRQVDTALLNKSLKINYSMLPGKVNSNGAYLLYASLPQSYKTANVDMSFDELLLMTANDSVKADAENAADYFEIGYSGSNNNIAAIKIKQPSMDVLKIKGKLEISGSGLCDTAFATTALPAAIKMFNNGKSFSFLLNELPVKSVTDIFGLKTSNASNAIVFTYGDNPTADRNNIIIHFEEPPAQLVVRYNKEEGFNYFVPFKFVLPKPGK